MRRERRTGYPLTLSVLDGIASLADKSLVQQVARPDGVPRFRMLETIREFGLEQLAATGETDETMQRLAGWGRSLMDGAEQGFYSTMQWQWVERFETELDNLRAVLAWALERDDAATAQVLVGNLGWLWVPRGFLSEGRAWGERALALGDRSPTPQRALSLAMTGTLSYYQGDLARARSLALEGLDQSRVTGQTAGEGISTMVLAWVASSEGSFDEAEAYATERLTHYRTAGNATWAGFALNTLGTIAYQRGDLDRAAIRFEEAHHAIRTVGNTYGIGFVLSNLAKVARDQGEYGRSAALYAESLALRYQQGEKQSMAGGLRGLASIAAATRQYVRAARLWGAAEALSESIGAPSTQPRAPRTSGDREDASELGRRGIRRCLGGGSGAHPGRGDERGPATVVRHRWTGRSQRAGRPVGAVRADAARGRGLAPDRRRALEPGDRRRALHHDAHGPNPRPAHPRQARRQLTDRGRNPGREARIAALSPPWVMLSAIALFVLRTLRKDADRENPPTGRCGWRHAGACCLHDSQRWPERSAEQETRP